MKNNNKINNHYLSSYCFYPDINFETQSVDEKIILLLRAHPITQISWIFNSLIFFVLIFGLNFITHSFFNINQKIFINFFAFFSVFSYVWFNFLSWFFNVGVITSERVVDIDFHMVLYKEVTATRLGKIEDITAKTGGYIASLFDFGNVFIQTAGTQANIEFINIPHPSKVVDTVNNLIRKNHGD